jgi:acetoin utilization deacetylase AcuC-like enzyme
MARTAWGYHERFLDHRTGASHPERPDRLRAILDGVTRRGLLPRLKPLPIEPVKEDVLNLNHSNRYLERLEMACAAGDPFIDVPDSAICPESEEIARLAVGAVVTACDAVMAGAVDNAYCPVRPPGHHAHHDRSAGFCLYNNAALAARYLQTQHGVARVMILDWDVHHCDGTQDAFLRDPTVLVCSLHEDPRMCYPGTGYAHERGAGPGTGFTLNIPMPAGATDVDYRQAFEAQVVPRMREFKPEFLVVSDGFDAHEEDPLAGICLSDAGFAWLMRQARSLAAELCNGRLVAVLEGGYDLGVLSRCVPEHVATLLNDAG